MREKEKADARLAKERERELSRLDAERRKHLERVQKEQVGCRTCLTCAFVCSVYTAVSLTPLRQQHTRVSHMLAWPATFVPSVCSGEGVRRCSEHADLLERLQSVPKGQASCCRCCCGVPAPPLLLCSFLRCRRCSSLLAAPMPSPPSLLLLAAQWCCAAWCLLAASQKKEEERRQKEVERLQALREKEQASVKRAGRAWCSACGCDGERGGHLECRHFRGFPL